MDHYVEIISLGLDALLFSVCYRLYYKYTFTINSVEAAQRLGINPNLNNLSEESRGYVIVQGTVRAIDQPIRSLNAPDVTGVIQKLTIKEHAVLRSPSGFWSNQKKTIQEAFNTVPFILKRGSYEVEVLDPLSNELLDLDTVSDRFEAKSLSLLDHMVGFFSGVRQHGIQSTEELLKQGSTLTVVGELSECEGHLQIGPPTSDQSYFLVATPVSSLLRKLSEQRQTFKWLSVITGLVGVALSVTLIRAYIKARRQQAAAADRKRRLDADRKLRRTNVRDLNLSEDLRCVVCQVNPKEVIIQPCGHVCLCEDCGEKIVDMCPVCRSPIENKAAAFI